MRSILPSCLIVVLAALSGSLLAQNCPTLTFTITGDPSSHCFCPGEPVTLIVNGPPGNFTYWWTDGTIGNPATFYFPSDPGFGIMSVNVVDENGCVYYAGHKYVMRCIELEIANDGPKCEGQEVALSVTAEVTPNNGFGGNITWSNGDWGFGDQSQTTVTDPGTYTATYHILNTGCTRTIATEVEFYPLPEPVIEGEEFICPGQTVDLSAVGGPYQTYTWDPLSGDYSTLAVTTPGTYSVAVTDEHGCKGHDEFTVNGLPAPTAFIIGPAQLSCQGTAVNLVVSGLPAQVEWSTGATTPLISVNQAGTYTVTVTNAAGCTQTATHSLAAPPTLSPPQIAAPGSAACPGDTVQLNVIGSYAAYAWSTGASTAALPVTLPGTYTVTVSNAQGCTATATQTVVIAAIPTPAVSPPFCTSDIVQLAVTGGPFAQYAWSNGDTTAQSAVFQPGAYAVTVTNTAGCKAAVAIGVDSALFAAPTIAAQPYVCNGGVILNASPGFAAYAWSTGATTAGITATASGTYRVTATNAIGCSATASLDIAVPPAPVVGVAGGGAYCALSGVVLTADAGFAEYAWLSGQTAAQVSVAQPGAYTVTVTDLLGCTASATVVVSMLVAPAPQISGPPAVCTGDTANLTVAGIFQQYEWSNGAITPAISVDQNAIYTVTVTDANGCTGTASRALIVGAVLFPAITVDIHPCDGTASLDAGAGFAGYAWSNGAATPAILVNADGAYALTVSDAGGCTGTAVGTVTIPSLPSLTISGPAAVCPGTEGVLEAAPGFAQYVWPDGQTGALWNAPQSGNFSVTATDANGCTAVATTTIGQFSAPAPQIAGPAMICTGGSADWTIIGNFVQYEWSDGSAAPTISVDQSGVYTVTVTDANGCTGTASQVLGVGAALSPVIAVEVHPCDGIAILDAGPGFAGYAWSNGAATPAILVNADGAYTLTVSDAGGCTGTAVGSVSIPPLPALAISGPAAVCPGTEGVLEAAPGFVQYVWPDGQTGALWNAPQSGNFSVTATDANGCTAVATTTIGQFPDPAPQIAGPAMICTGGSADWTIIGNFVQYEWSDGSAAPTISVDQNGIYTVTVTDTNGCTGTASQLLGVGAALSPVIAVEVQPCDGIAILDAGPGFAGYAWSNGAASPAILVNADGAYALTVSDAGGCTGTAVGSVSIPTMPAVAISGPAAFCPGASAVLSATPGFVQYEWSNGQITPDLAVAQSGIFTVTATDANGCTAVASTTVATWPPPAPQIAGPAAICAGSAVDWTVDGIFQNYQWSIGISAPAISVQQSGAYTVTVTDENGCTGTATQTLVVHDLPTPQASALPYGCDGLVVIQAGSGFVAYDWSNGANGATQSVPVSGAYTVTVSDANGCTGTASVAVAIPPPPVAAITGDPAICAGETAALTAAAGYSAYQWSGGQATPAIVATQAGAYAVTVTDGWGCTDSAIFDLAVRLPDVVFLENTSCFAQDTGTVVQLLQNQYGCDSTVFTVTLLAPPVLANASITSDFNGLAVSCAGAADGAAQVIAGGGAPPFTYLWSNGASGSSVQNLPAGPLGVTVTDAGGCSQSASLVLTAPLPTSFEVEKTGVACFSPGSITVRHFSGAGAPFVVWLDGQIVETDGEDVVFDQLLPGPYPLVVADANGCSQTITADLPAPTPVEQVFTDTITTEAGELLTLQAPADFPAQGWQWSPSQGLSCADCPDPTLVVTTEAVYEAVQTDGSGCRATGIYVVQLRETELETAQIYIPNVFEPGPGPNGVFTVFGNPQVRNIAVLRIFDRWGELLAELRDFPPNGPEGWRGDFRGLDCPPGVYLFYAEVVLTDDTRRFLAGDLTLVR